MKEQIERHATTDAGDVATINSAATDATANDTDTTDAAIDIDHDYIDGNLSDSSIEETSNGNEQHDAVRKRGRKKIGGKTGTCGRRVSISKE